MFSRAIVFFILTLCTLSVKAELISLDETTRDTLTGLEWLDLNNPTRGKSYNYVLGELEEGGLYHGYSYASFEQVSALYDNYLTDADAAVNFVDLFSDTFGLDQGFSIFRATTGYFGHGDSIGIGSVEVSVNSLTSETSFSSSISVLSNPDLTVGIAEFGHWLVKPGASEVAEPSLVFPAFGLFALLLFRRKFYQ